MQNASAHLTWSELDVVACGHLPCVYSLAMSCWNKQSIIAVPAVTVLEWPTCASSVYPCISDHLIAFHGQPPCLLHAQIPSLFLQQVCVKLRGQQGNKTTAKQWMQNNTRCLRLFGEDLTSRFCLYRTGPLFMGISGGATNDGGYWGCYVGKSLQVTVSGLWNTTVHQVTYSVIWQTKWAGGNHFLSYPSWQLNLKTGRCIAVWKRSMQLRTSWTEASCRLQGEQE